MYSNQEMRDMHYVHGLADGNTAEARRLYAERFPNRICPRAATFQDIHRRLGETGQLGRNPANAAQWSEKGVLARTRVENQGSRNRILTIAYCF